MNKKLIILIAIIVVICIVSVIVINSNKNEATSPVIEEEQLSSKVDVKTKALSYEYDKKKVSALIPQIETSNIQLNTFINNKMSTELDANKVYSEITAGMQESEIGLFIYDVKYDRYDCFDYLSLVCTQNIQLLPNRSITRTKTYNIDVKNFTVCEIKDIFANKGYFKQKLVEEVIAQSKSKGIELKEDGVFLTIPDTQYFYIKDYKLHLVFEPGEIAAVAFGELDFEMPFENQNGLFVF